jgi:hypothetical protein
MYIALPQDTIYYRVEKLGRRAREILSGMGAFFRNGGRYNASRQRTVYASADALVPIAETAFHTALILQMKIGQTLPSTQSWLGPLITRSKLWSFRLDHPCRVVDLLDPGASSTFGYPGYVLWNPSHQHYVPTQDVMSTVFHHHHPPGNPVQGVQAPSVRSAPATSHCLPHQHVFFLLANQLRGLPGKITECWNLEIEFLDELGGSRSMSSTRINWLRPRFRILRVRGLPVPSAIPAYAPRLGALTIQPDVWNLLDIQFV